MECSCTFQPLGSFVVLLDSSARDDGGVGREYPPCMKLTGPRFSGVHDISERGTRTSDTESPVDNSIRAPPSMLHGYRTIVMR